MARNAQCERQWRIWEILVEAREPLRVAEIAERLVGGAATCRTVRRDLELLRSLHVKIDVHRSGRELRYSARGNGPHLRLDLDGLLALRLAQGALKPYAGTPVGDALAHVARKLEEAIPAAALAHFASLGESVSVRSGPRHRLAPVAGTLQAVREALARRRVLAFAYVGEGGEKTDRRVHAQAFVEGPTGPYVLAKDEGRGGKMRTFRLERMEEARLVEVPAVVDGAFDPDALLAGSVGIHSPEHEPVDVVLRVHTATAVRTFRERPWHSSQVVREAKSGPATVSMRLDSTREVVGLVLAHGPDVEVMAPEALRRAVAERSAAAARRYRRVPAQFTPQREPAGRGQA